MHFCAQPEPQGTPPPSVEFIAEVSSNHNRDLDRCLTFIDTAARIGCAAVKFQLFRIEELFAPEILARSPDHRSRKAWELPVDFLPELANRCRKTGIAFGCTPFYLDAVEQLFPHVAFYKIASYELLWEELLRACARTGKPVILSTGMATMEEIDASAAALRHAGCTDLTLLHCVSSYPTPAGECNLSVIDTLRRRFHCPVGWSDHSAQPAVVQRAVHRWQAATVEFHLDLDAKGAEFGGGHCWMPNQMAEVIEGIAEGLRADGNPVKQPAPGEEIERDWRACPTDGLRPLLKTRASL